MNRRLFEKTERLLSKERGTVFKDPGGRISIALVYPNTYRIGMSSLGFQGIYGLLNGIGDVVCERVFFPDEVDVGEYLRTGEELFSLESRRRLSAFDVIAFSVSFENDYPNIIRIMKMAGIPARSGDRTSAHPLVIMGGVCAFYNPEPLSEFFDLCFLGEAEEMLPEFLEVFRGSSTKEEIIEKALAIQGVYVPGFYTVSYSETGVISERKALGNAPERIVKRTFLDIGSSKVRPVITTPETEFSDMYLIEAMRGCVWSCRFCVAGSIYKPARKKDIAVLRKDVGEALAMTSRVGLIGPSMTDYPHAEEVLSIEGVDFSVTSLRASKRSGTIVGLMKGHRSISIAPEAGTERLRRAINKRISDLDILETAKMILEGGIETLRLYFMVGLPTETREDIEGIVDLVGRIRANTKRGYITLSVSTFVPKPFTPFQWHAMEPLKEVKERLKIIKKGLIQARGVRVFHEIPKYAYTQGVFSLGDRRVSRLIEDAAAAGTMKKGLPAESEAFYVFRRRKREEIFPWDFIDAGVSREQLWEEYSEALSA